MPHRPTTPPVLCATVTAPPVLCATVTAHGNCGTQKAIAGDFGTQKRRVTERRVTERWGVPLFGLMLAALLASSCARTGYAAEPDPTFDASWMVDSLMVDGEEVDLQTDLIIVDIDTSTAEVEVATGCRALFGSFTFLDDGRAGFTLPGGTKPACDDDEEPWLIALDASFADAIAGVTDWSVDDDRLVLSGPTAELVLLRAG